MSHISAIPTESAVPVGRHPLAAAVAIALAGALIGGCATSGKGERPGAEVARAKVAYAKADYETAARLLAEPAMKGDPEAQYALGYMYYYGQGVPKDLYRARSWLEHSSNLGNKDAKRALTLLVTYGKLTPTDTAAVQEPAPATTGNAAAVPQTPAIAPVVETAAPPAANSAPPPAEPPVAAEAPVRPAATPVQPAAPAPVAAPAVQSTAEAAPASGSAQAQCAPVAEVAEARTETASATASAPAAATSPEALPSAPLPTAPAPVERQRMPAPAGAETAAASPIAPARAAAGSPRYTVHLLSTTEQDDLSRTVNAYELGSGAAYYQLGANYRLIYGAYATVAAAREALEALPAGLQRYKPWVNNYPAQVVVMHFETPATLVSSAKPHLMPSR